MKKIKNWTKNSSGITLIALVITIIVLLILAGVSLSLIMGNDGILGRAENAVTEHRNASVAEEVELAMAELQMQYYEDKYVNGGKYDGADIGEFAEYAEKKLTEGIATSNGTLKLEGGKVNYYEGTNTTPTATGTFDEDKGTVTIAGVTSGGSGNTGGNDGTTPEPEPTKYTVTYNANGGTGVPTDSNQYAEGATVTVNFTTLPTKEGFEFLGWATTADATTATYTSSGTTSFTMGTANVTLYAVWKEETKTFVSQITKDNYGEYVDLGTTYVKGNALETGTATEDWRIFYKDDNGVCLVLADYLPYSHEATLGTGLTNYGAEYPYNWNSATSRVDLINRLKGTASAFTEGNPWNKLISSDYTGKGIKVTGGLELETWVKSWNEKGYTNLKTATKTGMGDGLEGYYIGTAENPTTTDQSVSSDEAGYGNTLYFPHKSSVSNCCGYWLASPSADSSIIVMLVYYRGDVDTYSYVTASYGVRPAVYIPAGINAEKVDGVWELEI